MHQGFLGTNYLEIKWDQFRSGIKVKRHTFDNNDHCNDEDWPMTPDNARLENSVALDKTHLEDTIQLHVPHVREREAVLSLPANLRQLPLQVLHLGGVGHPHDVAPRSAAVQSGQGQL